MHQNINRRRSVDKFVRAGGRGDGMLVSAYIQIFGYSPFKIQCTAILLDRMNLKNWEEAAPLAPLVYTLE